jgi:hypothetical protein
VTKGERLYKDIKALGEIGQRSISSIWTMDREGATLRKRDG